MPHAEFEDVLRRTPDRLFRKLIQDRLRSLGAADAEALAREAEAGVPEDLRPYLPAYRQALERTFLQSRLFWRSSSCRQAISNILDVAAETIPEDGIRAVARRPLDGDPALPAALFEVAANLFVAAASNDTKLRRFMAIRKGWLR